MLFWTWMWRYLMFMSNPVILWVCEDWGQRFSLVSHCIPMPSYVCSSSVDICWMYGSLVISERTEAIAWKVKVNVAQLCLTLCDSMDCSLRNSPGQNTGVGSLSLLQGIFPPRDQTHVYHIAGGFFTSWAKTTHKCCNMLAKCNWKVD